MTLAESPVEPAMRGPVEAPVVVCLGGGGVGKTTLAACTAIAAASAGERVVVLTIDPARRLAATLGLDLSLDLGLDLGLDHGTVEDVSVDPDGRATDRGLGSGGALGNEPTLVAGPWPGELWAASLDPEETLRSVLVAHGSTAQADRIMANPLFATILGSLSGSNEYLAAERLHQLHHDDRFDRVIIDTPPSRHGVDFLDSPDRLGRFLGNRLYRLVLAPRTVLRPLNLATQVVARLTAKLVGADLLANVARLFADTEGLESGFRTRARETSALLTGPDCGYLVVTTAQREPMAETRWIMDRLEERGRRPEAVVVNRRLPVGRGPRPTAPDSEAAAVLLANWDELAQLARLEDALVDELRTVLPEGGRLIEVDEEPTPPITVDALAGVARALRQGG